MSAEQPLLKVRDLKTWFPVKKGLLGRVSGQVKAVDGVSFDIKPRETLGLVGESGCGKTTVGRTLLRLIPATGGTVTFEGQDVFNLGGGDLRRLRRKMQIIFQDPYSSLNPRMDIRGIVGEALQVHGVKKDADLELRVPAKSSEIDDRVEALMQEVGLKPEYMRRYPHEFSGGQRQRIGIARALALEPRFIVCDEAVSALDVSVQAQVLNLLEKLQAERGIAYLFISHDLSVVRHISDRVAVMYLGKIAEVADVDELYENPSHPYTRALLSSIPVPRPGRRTDRVRLEGDVPSPMNPPSGCYFHPRCPLLKKTGGVPACKEGDTPPEIRVAQGHTSACHMVEAATEV